ncbi:MAG TPA: BACON domain-containing carbohydrate-binding protein, partial [Vicinamibacterales bacterium]|nr:BACON domain-containing carbohydrate-binding protein [Vicinamibacterales bacterium]
MTLIAAEDSIAGSGGAGSITVTTQPECAWQAVAEAIWITNLIPSQGQGNAEVRFQISQNPSASARESVIVVNNQRAIIRQAPFTCQFGVGASNTQFAAAGGTGTITITSFEGCAWTASSDVSWIVVARSGTGSGSVSFTVAPNIGAVRTG